MEDRLSSMQTYLLSPCHWLVTQGNGKGRYSMAPMIPQFIFISTAEWTEETWNKVGCSTAWLTIESGNQTHYSRIGSWTLTTELCAFPYTYTHIHTHWYWQWSLTQLMSSQSIHASMENGILFVNRKRYVYTYMHTLHPGQVKSFFCFLIFTVDSCQLISPCYIIYLIRLLVWIISLFYSFDIKLWSKCN